MSDENAPSTPLPAVPAVPVPAVPAQAPAPMAAPAVPAVAVPAPLPAVPAVPVPARPRGQGNPAIKKAKAAPEAAEADSSVDNSQRNKDGFIPGQDVNWDQLMAHKAKGGRI